MRTGKLGSRLSRIRENQKKFGIEQDTVAAQSSRSGTETSVRADTLPDSETRSLTGWNKVGENLYERRVTTAVPGFKLELSPFFPLLFPREREFLAEKNTFPSWLNSLVFFDLETTGLSHGAGTVAFMAALGKLDSRGTISVTQLLIDDYPGEPAFLERFMLLAGDDPILVSFNGKGFDAQILQTRYLMNALRPSFLAAPHLDLLYPARRLWKNELGNCRLGTIEGEIFLSPRGDDLPGSEAPDAWFEYLRGAEEARLLAVGEHNLADVQTLGRLFFELDRRIDSGEGRAALIRALDLRGRKDYAGAKTFLEPLAREGNPIAARLLAIDAEHRLDCLDLALDLAREMGDDRRINRLESKLSRREDPLF